MVVYTVEQLWEILRHYFENHSNVAECVRKLRTYSERRETPSPPYVRYLEKKVKETGILIDKPKREKPKAVRTPENIAAVAESATNIISPSFSTIEHSGDIIETNFAYRLRYDGIKSLIVQELKPIDHPIRFHFAKWACDRLPEDADFGKKKHLFR